MTSKYSILLLVSAIFFTGWISNDNNWLSEKHKGYTLLYTSKDEKDLKEYNKIIKKGLRSVTNFFKDSYQKEFDVVIHPGRHSLDSTWQKDWNMPGFKSECWMVASGVANRLDMISPKLWDKEACEHRYAETNKTWQLITHELVHVYHGQLNLSPDFSNAEGIDWFVEGLATYASGQLDSLKIKQVKEAINRGEFPSSLDNFWKGKLRYGLSGSVVMFIDHQYGRTKLKALFPLTKKSEILAILKTTEIDLLREWRNYFSN